MQAKYQSCEYISKGYHCVCLGFPVFLPIFTPVHLFRNHSKHGIYNPLDRFKSNQTKFTPKSRSGHGDKDESKRFGNEWKIFATKHTKTLVSKMKTEMNRSYNLWICWKLYVDCMCLSTISTNIKLVFTMSLLHLKTLVTSAATPTVYCWSPWKRLSWSGCSWALQHRLVKKNQHHSDELTVICKVHTHAHILLKWHNESQWKSSLSRIKHYYFVEHRVLF